MRRRLGVLALLIPNVALAQLEPGEPDDLFTLEPYLGGLDVPMDIDFLPDGRQVLAERDGQVWVIAAADAGESFPPLIPAGNIALQSCHEEEQGLLGLAVDPGFATNHKLYFMASTGPTTDCYDYRSTITPMATPKCYYVGSPDWPVGTSPCCGGGCPSGAGIPAAPCKGNCENLDKNQVLVATLSDANVLGAPVVLTGNMAGARSHNGGGLAIYGDYLFIAAGEGGYPPPNNAARENKFAQCLNRANGSILRLHLDGSVPDDNPLYNIATVTTCDTRTGAFGTGAPDTRIWAWGVRNTFRITVDAQTGYVWGGDTGEGNHEEVNVYRADRNYGWPFREGSQHWGTVSQWSVTDRNNDDCDDMQPSRTCTEPAYQWDRGGFESGVIGGVIPDHCAWPEAYRSRYLFGDVVSGEVFIGDLTAARDDLDDASVHVFANLSLCPGGGCSVHWRGLSGMKQDPQSGDIYILQANGQSVLMLKPKAPLDCPVPPEDDGAPVVDDDGAPGPDGGTPGGDPDVVETDPGLGGGDGDVEDDDGPPDHKNRSAQAAGCNCRDAGTGAEWLWLALLCAWRKIRPYPRSAA